MQRDEISKLTEPFDAQPSLRGVWICLDVKTGRFIAQSREHAEALAAGIAYLREENLPWARLLVHLCGQRMPFVLDDTCS